MQLAIKSIIASIVLIISGCAISPEMHVSNMLEQTNASMVAGDLDSAHGYIASALSTPGQQAQISRFFAEKPERRDLYVKIMARHIDYQMSSPTQAALARDHINLSQRLAYITPEDAKALDEKLIARAQQGNTSGNIGFMLRDNLTGLGLHSARHKEIILKRSLATADGAMDAPDRQTAALMAYASDPATPAAHKALIQKSLDTIPITRNEMEQYVRPVFPQYANKQLASMTLKAAFNYQGGDRIAREDLLDSIREKVRGVEWLPYGSSGNTIVRVERLRYHERTERPRSEVIRYTRREVSSIFVTRDMPEGSFYSYRLTRSAAFIEYGYEVTVLVNGKVVHNTIVRGTERSESARCSDAVIRRPGGGVRPAEYDANNDMKKRCHSSGSGSLEDLRRRIDDKIADAVLAAPPIARIHHLNS